MTAAKPAEIPIPDPPGSERWNRAMLGAYRRGYRARLAGDIGLAPYVDKRKRSGRVSWSRAFIRAWDQGYCDAMFDHPESRIRSNER